MAAFKFRLEALLRVRTRVKEEEQWQLRGLNEAKQALELEITDLERQLREMDDVLAARPGEYLSVIDLKLAGESAQRIDRRIHEKTASLAELDDAIIAKKGELIEAMRGVKALERLRERQAEKFRREQDGAEQKFIDEVAQRKFLVSAGRNNFPRR